MTFLSQEMSLNIDMNKILLVIVSGVCPKSLSRSLILPQSWNVVNPGKMFMQLIDTIVLSCCYQITKIFCSKYGSADASSARGPCNFGPLADLAISVFREVSFYTVFTQIRTSRKRKL